MTHPETTSSSTKAVRRSRDIARDLRRREARPQHPRSAGEPAQSALREQLPAEHETVRPMSKHDPWPEDYEERGLSRLMMRWPDRRPALQQLRSRHGFMLLCAAYHAAHTAAEHWVHSTSPEAAVRVEEFRAVAAAIERDVAAIYLKSSDGGA